MTRGSTVFVDTNILLSATAAGRSDHEQARDFFRAGHAAGVQLALSGQVLREYLVVATRPVNVNGLGMDLADALRNVQWFRARTAFLEETEAVFDRLFRLGCETTAHGKRLHDLNVPAVMVHHGAEAIVTANADDYAGCDRVRPVSLAQAHQSLVDDAT